MEEAAIEEEATVPAKSKSEAVHVIPFPFFNCRLSSRCRTRHKLRQIFCDGNMEKVLPNGDFGLVFFPLFLSLLLSLCLLCSFWCQSVVYFSAFLLCFHVLRKSWHLLQLSGSFHTNACVNKIEKEGRRRSNREREREEERERKVERRI